MKTQLKINGELKDVEIENGEITIIEQKKNPTGWEIADKGRNYYCLCCLYPYPSNDYHAGMDLQKYKDADYFTEKTLALNISRMQTLLRQMFRWQAENDVSDVLDINNRIKYYLIFEAKYDRIDVSNTQYCHYGFLPYFSSKEKAQKCIEAFKDELMWLFKEFKWRMDG